MAIRLDLKEKAYYDGTDKNVCLKDFKLKIDYGEKILIMGESGSGKSSLLRILALLDTDFKGSLSLGKLETTKLDKDSLLILRSKYIGYIFQEYALLNEESLEDNLLFCLDSTKSRNEKDFEIDLILSLLELEDKRRKKVKQLSGGERQRVAIARALVNKPRILIADEPFNSIDSRLHRKILSYILENTQTLIMVTHQVEDYYKEIFRAYKLEGGKLMETKL